MNVNNNCSTGSSALFMARQAVKGGLAECALALGFEKMEKGALGGSSPTARTRSTSTRRRCSPCASPRPRRPRRRCSERRPRAHERYGSDPDHYAWIGWKNHKHSVNNPYAQFQDEYSLEDIKDAKMIA